MNGHRWSRWLQVGLALAVAAAPLRGQEGVVRGVVRHRGPVPKLEQLRVTVDRDVCGDSIPSRHLMVEAGKVRHTVVYLDGVSGAATPATTVATATLANRQCQFEPSVMASRVGAVLTLRNDDPMMHNVHLYHSQRTVANVALPGRAVAQNRRALSRPGLVEVKCDAHGWMRAAMWVFDHPYYAVTDGDGAFEIGGVPPGRYVLRVWHAVLGEQSRDIVVEAGQRLTVEFSLGAAAR